MTLFQPLPGWISRRPWFSALLLVAIGGLSLWQVRSLEIDSSTRGLINEKDPQKEVYERFKGVFGSDLLTCVVVHPPDGDVFTPETLAAVDAMTSEIELMKPVSRVASLTNTRTIKAIEDYLYTDYLIEELPETQAECNLIRKDAFANPIFVGTLLSQDGRFTAINIYTESSDSGDADREFLEALDAVIAEHKGGHTVFQVGVPRYNVAFNSYIQRDQMTLVPLSVLAMMLVFLISFRSLAGMMLPMVTASLSISAAMGFMGFMDYSLSAVSVMAPSVLIVVGCTEDVHLLSKYVFFLKQGLEKSQAIVETMAQSLLPISLTSLTTMVGFGVLSINEITAIREFGIICAFGLFANFIITLLATPLVFRVLKAPRVRVQKQPAGKGLGSFLDGVHQLNRRHQRAITLLVCLVVVLAVGGAFRLVVNNDPISFFKPDSPIRRDIDRTQADLAGVQSFYLFLEAESPGDMKEPDILRKMDALQEYLAAMGLFDKTLSLADYLKLTNREMQVGAQYYVVPESRNLVAQYLLLLENDQLFRHVDDRYKSAAITVRHGMSGSREVKRAVSHIETYMKDHFSHYVKDGQVKPLKWSLTGEALLLHRATDAMISGQVKSLIIALVAIFLLISSLFLSLKAGMVAMVSNIFPILCNFGMMGWLGIPFDSGTCLVATIALGIAVDDTIHFMVRYQRYLRQTNDQNEALLQTLHSEGRPILITSTALFLGFGLLVMSPFNPTMHFGILAALIMLYAVSADLFLNPLLLLRVQLITAWDYLALKISGSLLKDSLIFKGLRPSEIKTFALLGHMEQCKAGDLLIQQGEQGDAMFVLLSGQMKVSLTGSDGKNVKLDRVNPGALIGEMAYLGSGIRTATVKAATDAELLRIDDKALDRVRHRNPKIAAKIFLNFSRVLSERVTAQNFRLV